jgi:glycosyltransferase involved in cell wall biosynthesis
MNQSLVTACLITYNQVKYVRQSIEGMLMQQTDFPWGIIVADDCSTDGTQEILKEYQAKDPDKITLLLQPANKGAMLNWIDLVTMPKSRYITLCEGDDYWTDPFKLQKQVDFLEANPEYVACFHPVKVVDADGKELRSSKNSFVHNRDLTQDELIMGRVMSTLSLCYRNVIAEFPQEFYKSPTGDNFLCSLLGNYGKAKFLDDIKPSAYRMHTGGSWSLQQDDKKKMTLLLSYFWLWQYYARIGKPEYAQGYYRKILLEGFYSDPFRELVPGLLGRTEWVTIKTIRRVFRLLRNLAGKKQATVKK